jgi:4-hydroxythreonine-4-phosphate dehydrogenase
MSLPCIAVTMGDPAGIGPEIVVAACSAPQVRALCQPVIFGSIEVIREASRWAGPLPVREISLTEVPAKQSDRVELLVLNCTDVNYSDIQVGRIQAEAGRAAAESVIAAAKAVLSGSCDAMATAPLHKEALHLAGFDYPGHTEMLAEICGVKAYGMMLYLPAAESGYPFQPLAVVHVTLHTAMRQIFEKIRPETVLEKITLISGFLRELGISNPRIGVAALNPHAGEHGLFGKEEEEAIEPAVEQARRSGLACEGPLPADTLFLRALHGDFDGVVAMYHDQGHIPVKLLGMHRAVNVTVGLPIIRTSVAHGTAFDIAGRGQANPQSMIEAICLAAKLARRKKLNRPVHGTDVRE